MVLVRLLGFIDIAVAILLLLTEFGMPITRFYIIFVAMHAIKALVFLRNLFSIIDLFIVAYTIILPFWSEPMLTIFIALFLFYKGIWSQF